MDADSRQHAPLAEVARDNVVTYRRPAPIDAPHLHALVADSPPLDLNSTYAYLLVCAHFADTSVVAECDGDIVGLVSGYRKPEEPAVLFVWQVAVAASARGWGIGRRMLRHLLARERNAGVRAIETTITPSNGASWRLFRALARDLGARVTPVDTFESGLVGGPQHEAEQLIRIDPITHRSTPLHGGT